MKSYRVTIWERWQYGSKYCYVMSCTDIDQYKKTLRDNYNRFTVEEV